MARYQAINLTTDETGYRSNDREDCIDWMRNKPDDGRWVTRGDGIDTDVWTPTSGSGKIDLRPYARHPQGAWAVASRDGPRAAASGRRRGAHDPQVGKRRAHTERTGDAVL